MKKHISQKNPSDFRIANAVETISTLFDDPKFESVSAEEWFSQPPRNAIVGPSFDIITGAANAELSRSKDSVKSFVDKLLADTSWTSPEPKALDVKLSTIDDFEGLGNRMTRAYNREKARSLFMSVVESHLSDVSDREEGLNRLKAKGYDAVEDLMDRLNPEYAEGEPLLVLDPDKSLNRIKSKKLT